MSWLTHFARRLRTLRGERTIKPEPASPANQVQNTGKKPARVTKPTSVGSQKHKPNYIASFDGLVDIVEHEGQPHFMLMDEGQLLLTDKVTIGDRTYIPPRRSKIPFTLIEAASLLTELESVSSKDQKQANSDLFDSVKNYLYQVSDLPTPEHYDLCAAWIMHTYRIEGVQFSPVIWLFGVPERGKTRTGKGMALAAHRGLHVESLNPAYILRVSRDWGGTLFIDVVDAWRRAERSDSVDILLLRYERDAKVPRVLFPEKGPFEDTEYFSIFGPTILGTNKGVHATLESRSIQIVMSESSRTFDKDITPEAALPLRLRLLAYRARYLGQRLPQVAKKFPGRFGDLVRPLCQIIEEVAPHRVPVLDGLLWQLYKERLSSKSESFEATVLTAIARLTLEAKNGLLPVKRITEKINEDRPDSKKLSPQKVGWTLKSLGFDRSRATKTGGSALIWDDQKLAQVLAKYGLEKLSETSETSEPNLPEGATSDVSEVSEPFDLPF